MSRSSEPAIVRLSARVSVPDDGNGCWEWMGYRGRHGHGQILSDAKRLDGTHRVSWEFFNGPIPDGLHVLHRCDHPPCVNPAHLFLGTPADNMADCAKKGRTGRAVLTPDKVRAIRARLAAGEPVRAVARDIRMSQRTVAFIKQGKTWKHVQ